jgi:hypothetical protein
MSGMAATLEAQRVLQQQEEEEMTAPYSGDFARYEYKILRSITGAFRDPTKFKQALEEEARAGWELLEKFDDTRLRLRRPVECRKQDDLLGQDPYRSWLGMSPLRVSMWLAVGCSIVAFGVFILVLVLVLGP